MFSFNSKKTSENIDKIPDIIKRLVSLEKFHIEKYALQKDEYQNLITKQKKDEILMGNMQESLDTIQNDLQNLNYVKEEELRMVEYIRSYDESLFQMERIFGRSGGSGPQWSGQIHKTRQQLWKNMKSSEIYIISDTGVPVDASLHKVMQSHDAEDPQESDTVDEIITPGIIFKNHVLRKAKITAYK